VEFSKRSANPFSRLCQCAENIRNSRFPTLVGAYLLIHPDLFAQIDFRLFCRCAGSLIVVGAEILGIAGALILVKFLSTLLSDVRPIDPLTLAAVALLSGATALAASYLPARAATNVDPAIIFA
jgi:hypothetical protein